MAEFKFDSELAFAKEFYKQAVDGLEEDEYPPTPDEWLANPAESNKKWEFLKSSMVQEYESLDSSDHKKQIEAFLQCSLCVYFDLMASISVMKAGGKTSYTQTEIIELLKDEGLLELKSADDYIDENIIPELITTGSKIEELTDGV